MSLDLPELSPPRERARQALLERLRNPEPVVGHDLVARSLVQHGVTHVFGVPGRPVSATLAACVRAGIRVIGARHQQGATLMSIAFNYVAGGLRSAVIVSAGPAVTNTATGVLVAHDNRWPLLVIGGRRGVGTEPERAFQAFDGCRFLAPITKFAVAVAETGELAGRLAQAFSSAMHGAPGPVYIDAAEEALAGRVRQSALPSPASAAAAAHGPCTAAHPDAINEAVRALAGARRPVLLIGKGLRWSGEWTWLRQLVDEHSIPFAAAPMARGFLPDDHPLCVSTIRGRALADADLVLMVGARFNWTFHYGLEIPPRAKIIRIDIDPDESRQVLERGIALHGDAAATMRRLLDALAESTATSPAAHRDTDWLARLRALRSADEAAVRAQADLAMDPMSPFQWLREVGEVLPATAITVLDGNVAMSAAQAMLPVLAPVTRMTAATNGCMGTGIPFAIGAKLARPELPVVAICGDFGFGLSGIELETAIRNRVPIVAIVANNGGPSGTTWQRQFFGPDCDEPVAHYADGVRHDLIMNALGGHGVRVQRPGEMGRALSEAFASDAPTCIDVVTNGNVPVSQVI